MAQKNFYLLGREDTTSRRIDLRPALDFEHIRQGVASEYGIVVPDGVDFHNQEISLQTYEDIMDCEGPIGITVDGKAVREPPTPKGYPLVGNYFEIYPDHLGNHTRLFSQLGSVIQTNILGRVSYYTNDPRAAQVIFSENESFTKAPSQPGHPLYGLRDQDALFLCDTSSPAFKVSHKFVPPSMSPKAVKHYTPTIQAIARSSFSIFDELDDKDKGFNVYHYMMKIAGQVICELVLGWDVEHFASADAPIHEIINVLARYLLLNRKVQTKGDWYQYLPFGHPAELVKVRNHLYTLMESAIERSKRGGIVDLPMHDAALRASSIVDYLVRATDSQGNKLPHEYVLSNSIALVGAGFVTSSSFLSWLLYSLVTYPGNQARLLQELVDELPAGAFYSDSLQGDITRHLTYDLVSRLKFLDHFVKEAQRLHSPSFQPARNTKRDVILPGGYHVPANAILTPTMPHLHTNPAHWANPLTFEPDRWGSPDERGTKRHKSAYVPFAAGPRGCVGFNVALLEVKVVIAALVGRYTLINAGKEPVIYDPEFLVVRPLNFYVRAVKRQSWPERSAASKRSAQSS